MQVKLSLGLRGEGVLNTLLVKHCIRLVAAVGQSLEDMPFTMFTCRSMNHKRETCAPASQGCKYVSYLKCFLFLSFFPTDALQSRLGNHKIIVPTLVNSHGEFLSYDIINSRKRTRRDVSQNNNIILSQKNMHYRLPMLESDNTADIHLNLSINTKLVTKNYIVEYRNATGVSHRHRGVDDCHYHGHIIGHHRSRVALSNCNGLVS